MSALATGAPALEARGLTKRFGGFEAVSKVDLVVEAGQVCGFIGPNGAGKTTTMRICATLDLPDEGEVSVCGRSALLDPRAARRSLGFMPDHYGAYANTTVEEYIDFFARAHGLRHRERTAAIRSVTEFTGLDVLAGKEITKLSKGMKQRLCLAKTLLHDPTLLILDEPAAGLDPRARVELRELIHALADQGKAILVSSHILSELGEIASTVAVIEKGHLKASGRLEDLHGEAAARMDLYVRALCARDAMRRFLAERPHVEAVRPEREGLRFSFEGDERGRAELLAAMVSAGLEPIELTGTAARLEDVFLRLTEGEVQ